MLAMRFCTYVYLSMFKALLQIVIDSLIGDLADQSKVRDADLLLLREIENSSDWSLSASGIRSLCTVAVLFTASTLRHTLKIELVSPRFGAVTLGDLRTMITRLGWLLC